MCTLRALTCFNRGTSLEIRLKSKDPNFFSTLLRLTKFHRWNMGKLYAVAA